MKTIVSEIKIEWTKNVEQTKDYAIHTISFTQIMIIKLWKLLLLCTKQFYTKFGKTKTYELFGIVVVKFDEIIEVKYVKNKIRGISEWMSFIFEEIYSKFTTPTVLLSVVAMIK